MKIYIGADHAGYKLKEELEKYLKSKKHTVIDVGAHKFNKNDDYPKYAAAVGNKVKKDKKSRGILLCGNAEGICIAANKLSGIRAAIGYSEYAAKTSRTDDDANILCLAGRVLKPAQAKKITSKFLNTRFSGAKRHKRRIKQIKKLRTAKPDNQKINIIPAILAKDAIDFAQKLRLVESSVDTVQIDIMDKKFVPYQSWADPEIIKTIPTPLEFELHLMVSDPLAEVKKWKKIKNVKTAIFHIEIKKDPAKIIASLKRRGLKVGIALNPRTPLSKIEKLVPKVNQILFLGVTPGRSGQKFQAPVLGKIKTLRKKHPKAIIGIDGGVNLKNAPELIKAGVNSISTASAIYKSKNAKKVINELKKLSIK